VGKISERRKTYFIEKKFQTRFILRFCLLVLFSSLIFAGITYLVSKRTLSVSFIHAKAKVLSTSDFLFPILVQTVIVVTVAISFFTVILALFFSHKIAGPLYRLKKELEAIGKGILVEDFHFRKKDQLQDLALSLSSMVKRLREKIGDLKSAWGQLKDSLKELAKEDKEKIQKIDDILEYFKI